MPLVRVVVSRVVKSLTFTNFIFNKLPLIINTHKNRNINRNSKNNSKNNSEYINSLLNISTHKSFIYLIFIICVILDWFIWNNSIQTSLFISILILLKFDPYPIRSNTIKLSGFIII